MRQGNLEVVAEICSHQISVVYTTVKLVLRIGVFIIANQNSPEMGTKLLGTEGGRSTM